MKGDQASKAVVLVFWMPHVGIGQAACFCIPLQLARPNCNDASRMGVALE
jgi:hypothetical protein